MCLILHDQILLNKDALSKPIQNYDKHERMQFLRTLICRDLKINVAHCLPISIHKSIPDICTLLLEF